MWPDPADTEKNIAYTREFSGAMKPWSTGRAYLNFLGDEGSARVEAAFGPEKFARLQALKDEWDPTNLFRINQNIPPSAGASTLTARRRPRSASVQQNARMIREHAILDVIPGEEARFEQAFAEAKSIIASMPGFGALTLDRCIEQPTRYLLLVEWERLEDHTEGFRGSPEYEQWRALLHHFYEPFPVVDHYEPLLHA